MGKGGSWGLRVQTNADLYELKRTRICPVSGKKIEYYEIKAKYRPTHLLRYMATFKDQRIFGTTNKEIEILLDRLT